MQTIVEAELIRLKTLPPEPTDHALFIRDIEPIEPDALHAQVDKGHVRIVVSLSFPRDGPRATDLR